MTQTAEEIRELIDEIEPEDLLLIETKDGGVIPGGFVNLIWRDVLGETIVLDTKMFHSDPSVFRSRAFIRVDAITRLEILDSAEVQDAGGEAVNRWQDVDWGWWLAAGIVTLGVACLGVAVDIIFYLQYMHYQHYPELTDPQFVRLYMPQISVACICAVIGFFLTLPMRK